MSINIQGNNILQVGGESDIRFTRPRAAAAAFVGAYDFLGSDLVHLYATRRGRSDYADTEPLVRIRNNSTQAEQDFTSVSGGEDLDTAAISTFLAGATGTVVTDYDQVGGDDITQGTAAKQPLYVESGQNGKPVPRFDGTDDNLRGPFTNGGALSQPFSVLAVAQLDASVVDVSTRTMTAGGDTSNRILLRQTATGDPNSWGIYMGTEVAGNASDSNWNVWSVLANGASSQFWINGASQASGDAGSHNADGFTIGSNSGGTTNWKGDIPEIAIVDPSMSTADRQTAEQAAADYWGITIT